MTKTCYTLGRRVRAYITKVLALLGLDQEALHWDFVLALPPGAGLGFFETIIT